MEKSVLEAAEFPSFGPLLLASADYARHSGCRFRSSSFKGLPDAKASEEGDLDPRCLSKVSAAPAVEEFSQQLREGDEALLEEVAQAYRMLWRESTRAALVARVRELDLWPPIPAPAGVHEKDCDYRDMTATLPVLAQRLYNDEASRSEETTRRFSTASFLADFGYESGVAQPEDCQRIDPIIDEFDARCVEWMQLMQPPVKAGGAWMRWPWPFQVLIDTLVDVSSSILGLFSRVAGAFRDSACLPQTKKLE
eukprot:TRINITY_DN33917_c0_g1_i1.p1 TRINITY_DN33917_c0_g1~~TRINITY_DN33917_c0_g1_i1.p1  ORF type:complete len:265 (-),score=57.52 TRINITY_DN33917_c0_g1_i1:59-814(-)